MGDTRAICFTIFVIIGFSAICCRADKVLNPFVAQTIQQSLRSLRANCFTMPDGNWVMQFCFESSVTRIRANATADSYDYVSLGTFAGYRYHVRNNSIQVSQRFEGAQNCPESNPFTVVHFRCGSPMLTHGLVSFQRHSSCRYTLFFESPLLCSQRLLLHLPNGTSQLRNQFADQQDATKQLNTAISLAFAAKLEPTILLAAYMRNQGPTTADGFYRADDFEKAMFQLMHLVPKELLRKYHGVVERLWPLVTRHFLEGNHTAYLDSLALLLDPILRLEDAMVVLASKELSRSLRIARSASVAINMIQQGETMLQQLKFDYLNGRTILRWLHDASGFDPEQAQQIVNQLQQRSGGSELAPLVLEHFTERYREQIRQQPRFASGISHSDTHTGQSDSAVTPPVLQPMQCRSVNDSEVFGAATVSFRAIVAEGANAGEFIQSGSTDDDEDTESDRTYNDDDDEEWDGEHEWDDGSFAELSGELSQTQQRFMSGSDPTAIVTIGADGKLHITQRPAQHPSQRDAVTAENIHEHVRKLTQQLQHQQQQAAAAVQQATAGGGGTMIDFAQVIRQAFMAGGLFSSVSGTNSLSSDSDSKQIPSSDANSATVIESGTNFILETGNNKGLSISSKRGVDVSVDANGMITFRSTDSQPMELLLNSMGSATVRDRPIRTNHLGQKPAAERVSGSAMKSDDSDTTSSDDDDDDRNNSRSGTTTAATRRVSTSDAVSVSSESDAKRTATAAEARTSDDGATDAATPEELAVIPSFATRQSTSSANGVATGTWNNQGGFVKLPYGADYMQRAVFASSLNLLQRQRLIKFLQLLGETSAETRAVWQSVNKEYRPSRKRSQK
eukprot:TRINITY_DN12030_c0_g1_i1.p1 TRINITY_DN12030_c0_g1~~TRINITY_DN12030_c0_g1_i1.p1  ORF type:complete len:846 (-),score=151.88 TRINITY_DN12030_c0_g1_i1:44-2581(-)